MTLRDMTPADLDLVAVLDRELFGVDSWPRQMFEDELAQPQSRRYIVAEIPGSGGVAQTVGYAGLMCLPPLGDIQTLGVLPAYEGRGYARAMLGELIAEAARRGAEDVMLEVSSINPRAQELYRRFGFEHIHTRPRYYRDGSDGFIMRLRLDPSPTHPILEDPS
ncbi:ribosomal protein S18-alanine N-acetyltransferase [Specibacter sp. NPDC057265]|uniref:ribosomal protein S18-alanine N-acetyltransferase n=1 Tax=Specibacter sp. NPDC057265 TaxID=3346075 RepID=UPI003644D8D7